MIKSCLEQTSLSPRACALAHLAVDVVAFFLVSVVMPTVVGSIYLHFEQNPPPMWGGVLPLRGFSLYLANSWSYGFTIVAASAFILTLLAGIVIILREVYSDLLNKYREQEDST